MATENGRMHVRYRAVLDPERGELRMQLDLAQLTPGSSTLLAPAAAGPGTAPCACSAIRAIDPASGDALYLRPHGWGCYTVTQPGDALAVSYTVTLAAAADASASVPLQMHHLHVAAHDGPCLVRYELPAGWVLQHPAGARAMDDNSWEYETYAQLRATPVSACRIALEAG